MTAGWYVVTPHAVSRKHRRRFDADAQRDLVLLMGRGYLGASEVSVEYASSQREARAMRDAAARALAQTVLPTSPSEGARG